MNNLHNFVDEHNDFILQAISCLWKLANLTDRKDHVNFSTRYLHFLELFIVCQSSCNNLSPFVTEASLQKRSYFENCKLKHFCLHLSMNIFFTHLFILWNWWLFERALSQILNYIDNFLDRNNHNFINIASKFKRGGSKYNTGKQGDVELGLSFLLSLTFFRKPSLIFTYRKV